MIPQIVDITETEHGYFYVTTEGQLCASFKIDLIDIESDSSAECIPKIEFLLRQIPHDITYHFHLDSGISHAPPEGFSREEAFQETGFLDQRAFVHFEIPSTGFAKGTIRLAKALLKREPDPHLYQERIKKLFSLIPFDLFESSGLKLSSCTLDEVKGFFLDPKFPIIPTKTGLICAGEYVGVLKLYKLASQSSLASLARARIEFPQPHTISTRVRKISETKLKAILNNGRRQEERQKGVKASEKADAKDQAIAATDNHGVKYLYLEMHIVLKRASEAELLKDLKATAQKIYSYGEFTMETADGCEQSFAASLPGGRWHLLTNLLEKDSGLACYLPIFSYGVSLRNPSSISAFAYHRRDLSLDFYDSGSKLLPNRMQNIFAKAGSGKSVMLNLHIEALAQNPKGSVYLIDVAGSHVRTTLDLGGSIIGIDMNSKTPVNPFRHLKNPTQSIVSTLKNCVIELLLDNNETSLSTAEAFYVDEAMLKYVEEAPVRPSIPDFINFLFPGGDDTKTLFPKFPRKEHLLRFSKRGIYKNTFSTADEEELSSRLRYFNIQQISTATHSAITKAIVASVMADFWVKVETKPKDEPLTFIVDEAPMIVAANHTSLTHQTTNTRKENGSLILVAQKVEHLVVGGNTTLLSNAGTNIFLGSDDKLGIYQNALQLTDEDISQIMSLHIKPGEYSQFFIKNQVASHLGMLILSKNEYWRTTSTPEERERIEAIQKILPNLGPNHIAKLIAENEKGVLL